MNQDSDQRQIAAPAVWLEIETRTSHDTAATKKELASIRVHPCLFEPSGPTSLACGSSNRRASSRVRPSTFGF